MRKILVAAVLMAVLGACAGMGGSPTSAKFEGGMLVNSAGMTLYSFDNDAAGSGNSVCNGPCAANRPSLKATDSDHMSGDRSNVVRDDGSKQLAYKGKSVYLRSKDQNPGDKTGDGFLKVWHVIAQ